ncbi:MAG: hypothetical protein R3F21_22870 [Myxococcota bacterium]
MAFAAANRDERVFKNGETFDPDHAEPTSRSASASISASAPARARTELRIALESCSRASRCIIASSRIAPASAALGRRGAAFLPVVGAP